MWKHIPTSASSADTAARTSDSNSGASLRASKSKQSPTSKSRTTAGESSERESATALLTTPRSGMTLEHSTGDLGLDGWILSLADSRAPTSVVPEDVLELGGEREAGCSMKTCALLEKVSRDLSCSKTWRAFTLESRRHENLLTPAYVAGLIDGEGCISVNRSKTKSDYIYSARIDVGMSAKAGPLLKMLHTQFGGGLRQIRKRTRRWAAAYAWGVFGHAAGRLLRDLLPHLVLKRQQASLGIELQDMIAGKTRGWTKKMRELNRKGPLVNLTPKASCVAMLVAGRWMSPQRDLFSELGLAPFSARWPKRGTMRGGRVYALPTLVRRTVGNGGSAWLTPKRPSGGPCDRNTPGGGLRKIEDQVAGKELNWPGCRATDWGGRGDMIQAVRGNPPNKHWGTPRQSEWKGCGPKGSKSQKHRLDRDYLDAQAIEQTSGRSATGRSSTHGSRQGWSTPRVGDVSGGDRSKWTKAGKWQEGLREQAKTQGTGQLNPDWVETLMGLPEGWTDLRPMSGSHAGGAGWNTERLTSPAQTAGKEAASVTCGPQDTRHRASQRNPKGSTDCARSVTGLCQSNYLRLCLNCLRGARDE